MSKSTLELEEFNGHRIYVYSVRKFHLYWFRSCDVLKVLNLSNDAIDKFVHYLNKSIITSDLFLDKHGVYALMSASNAPHVDSFRDWIDTFSLYL